MGIISKTFGVMGQNGVSPRRVQLVTTDNLATVTTAGYLSNQKLSPDQVKPTDIFDVIYSYSAVSGAGTYAVFLPTITAGVVTLALDVSEGNVTLPVVSGNVAQFNGTTGLIQDSGIAAVNLALSSLSSPDAQSDLIWYDVTCSAAALATAGKVNIQVSSGTKRYKLRDVKVNYGASGLSGGGGDRLLAISDATTVYNNAGITAALLGTPINTVWGGTGNPVAGTVAQNTSTVAGANLYFQYSGGTTDYTTGSVVISVLVQRVV